MADRGRKQESDLLRTTSACRVSIAVGFLLTVLPCVSAQSIPAGGAAHAPRSTKDAPSTNGPDIWDANHDGIYTCDEWKGYLDRLFTLADRNRDQHLDPSEFTTIRRAGATLADADFGYFDENQDGKITRSEFVDKPSEFILRFDKNGDCRVTQDEMKGASTDQKRPGGRGKKF
jgi:EF hand domain-containing protein